MNPHRGRPKSERERSPEDFRLRRPQRGTAAPQSPTAWETKGSWGSRAGTHRRGPRRGRRASRAGARVNEVVCSSASLGLRGECPTSPTCDRGLSACAELPPEEQTSRRAQPEGPGEVLSRRRGWRAWSLHPPSPRPARGRLPGGGSVPGCLQLRHVTCRRTRRRRPVVFPKENERRSERVR